VDIAPTMLRAAGIRVPEYMDGRDLYLTAHDKVPPRTEVISEEYQVMCRAMIRTSHNGVHYFLSMRTRPEDFVRGEDLYWATRAPLAELDVHLFDIDKDPREVKNLAGDPAYLPVAQALRNRLQNRIFVDRCEPRWREIIPQRMQYGR